MQVISLGWGVQSWGLAAMSALGVLPKVDVVIHADTTHERSETYEFATKWTPWLEERGVKVITVKDSAATQAIYHTTQLFIPAYTSKLSSGKRGQLRRSCTQRWKIAPIRRWLQKHRDGRQVELWMGITLDEVGRMRLSNVKYIHNKYPFLEMFDNPWRRSAVIRWLLENNLEIPIKSSCIFCPYHDKKSWRELKTSNPVGWQKALEIDRNIRYKRPEYGCYLSRDLKPLEGCDFSSQEDHGQLLLWKTDKVS